MAASLLEGILANAVLAWLPPRIIEENDKKKGLCSEHGQAKAKAPEIREPKKETEGVAHDRQPKYEAPKSLNGNLGKCLETYLIEHDKDKYIGCVTPIIQQMYGVIQKKK